MSPSNPVYLVVGEPERALRGIEIHVVAGLAQRIRYPYDPRLEIEKLVVLRGRASSRREADLRREILGPRTCSEPLHMNAGEIALGLGILQIIWIDILLSGDNAILIALACHKLPARQRRWGIVLGAGGGVALRIAFAFVVVQLMAISALKTVGGLLLLGVAIKLLVGETEHGEVTAKESLWDAVFSIIIADAVMSLDNVIAIAGAARGSMELIVFGLALSVPIVVFGAGMLTQALDRFPVLVWAGAGLLGWIAGELIATDPWWAKLGWIDPETLELVLAVAGAVMVLAAGWISERLEARAEARRKACLRDEQRRS